MQKYSEMTAKKDMRKSHGPTHFGDPRLKNKVISATRIFHFFSAWIHFSDPHPPEKSLFISLRKKTLWNEERVQQTFLNPPLAIKVHFAVEQRWLDQLPIGQPVHIDVWRSCHVTLEQSRLSGPHRHIFHLPADFQRHMCRSCCLETHKGQS